MGNCSNPRCMRPKPGHDRCSSCKALVEDVLIRYRYKIEKTMGRGGFGTTYLSQDLDRFNAPCLLKELNPTSNIEDETADQEMAERLFKREAQVLLNLSHDGIPKLHAYFVEKEYSYLVQDYIPGYTLSEEIEQRKRNLNEQEARALLFELADILEYLHNHNPPIIHRDIKPQNLMRHASGQLLLIDFGAVCQAASVVGRTLIGSPGYVPPEQILGRPVPQSDLYAAGAMILRLMSGLHPSQLFNNKTRKMEWENHISVSKGFAAILNDLVTQEVSLRLKSAKELKLRLQAIASESPVVHEATVNNISIYEWITAAQRSQPTQNLQAKTQGFVTMEEAATPVPSQIISNIDSADEMGNLTETPILFLLRRFYRERFSGSLICYNNGVTKTIYFEQGTVAFANSTLKSERLGERLISLGRISLAEFEKAANLMREKKMRLGTALVEMGCITSEELRPLVVSQVANIIYSLFLWTNGEFAVRHAAPPEITIKISVSTADLIFSGLRRMENIDLIKRWLGDFTRKLTATTDPRLLYQIVNLQPQEAFIVSRIDSVMSLEDLLSLGGLPEADTFKTVCGLLAVGILEWTDDIEPAAPQPAVVANLLTQPQPLPNHLDIQTAAEFCYEVENTLRGFNDASHYAVLGVAWNAGEEEVHQSYARLAKKFHPDRHTQLVNYNLSLRSELEKLFARISEAHNVLSNATARAEYNRQAGYRKPSTGTLAQNSPSFPIKKPIDPREERLSSEHKPHLSAQNFFQKGLEFYNSSQYEMASRAFWAATTASPLEAEFRIYLARCLAMMQGQAQEAEQEFLKAIELSPQNADYYVQLGLFYQKINISHKAMQMFKKALEIAPNHALALRASRTLPSKN